MKLKTANLQFEKKICWVLVRRLQKREIFYNNTVDLRHLSVMSKESKVHSIYNVDSNSKYLN